MNQEEIDRLRSRQQRQNGGQPQVAVSDDRDERPPQSDRYTQYQDQRQGPRHEDQRRDRMPPPSKVRSSEIKRRTSNRVITRDKLKEMYPLAYSGFGLLCGASSVYTNMYLAWWFWDIAFNSQSWFKYILGVILAAVLFLGQILNSDYELFDENGNRIGVDRGKRRGYFSFLTPDSISSQVFFLLPAMRIFVHIFMYTPLYADDVRDLPILWKAAWNTDERTFVAYTLCLLISVSAATAWGVVSAYFPEKALLGPRTRAMIRAYVERTADKIRETIDERM